MIHKEAASHPKNDFNCLTAFALEAPTKEGFCSYKTEFLYQGKKSVFLEAVPLDDWTSSKAACGANASLKSVIMRIGGFINEEDCFFLGLMLTVCFVTAVSAESLFLYHDIPFSLTSSSEVEQALTEVFGEVENGEFGGYRIHDFGYDLRLNVHFRANGNGIESLFLGSDGIHDFEEDIDSFRLLVQRQLDQILDMENRITQVYGEPSFRFFYTRIKGVPALTRFMFPDDDWNSERLMEVYEPIQYIEVYSVWNNMMLWLTSNGIDKAPRGYHSRLQLRFKYKSDWKGVPDIKEYTPD